MRSKIILLLFFVSINNFSQEKTYFDSPFGFGVGYTPVWVIRNFDFINPQLKNFGTDEFSSSGFFSSGGAGFIYVGFVPNLRLGGMGFGGSNKESKVVNGFNNVAKYSQNFAGITAEYTFPLIRSFALSFGMILGWGGQQLELSRNKGEFSWDGIWREISDPLSSTQNFSRVIKNNFILLSPTINIDYNIYRFVSMRIGAGYSFNFGNEWQVEKNLIVNGVPDNAAGDSFFIQSGIFIGFFSY